MLQQTN